MIGDYANDKLFSHSCVEKIVDWREANRNHIPPEKSKNDNGSFIFSKNLELGWLNKEKKYKVKLFSLWVLIFLFKYCVFVVCFKPTVWFFAYAKRLEI